MAILALLPLIFSGIKLAIELVNYLQAHPEVPAEIKGALQAAGSALETAQGHVGSIQPRVDTEAP